jgi:hypothetical protein
LGAVGEVESPRRAREGSEAVNDVTAMEMSKRIADLEAEVARLTKERDEAFNRGAHDALDYVGNLDPILADHLRTRYPKEAKL